MRLKIYKELGDFIENSLGAKNMRLKSLIGWYCFENPLGGMYGEVTDGNALASWASISYKKLAPSPDTLVAEIGNNETVLEYQKKGLFSSLVNALGAQVDSKTCFIYVTVNGNSAPGYEKLKYSTSSTGSLLYFMGEDNIHLPSQAMALKISQDEFFFYTKNMTRLLNFDKAYFEWRYSRPHVKFNFYQIIISGNICFCSTRSGLPGPERVDVLCELVSKLPIMPKEVLLIGSMVKKEINSNRKLLLHSTLPLDGLEVFRSLPFVYKLIMQDGCPPPNFENYQLTDSDYA